MKTYEEMAASALRRMADYKQHQQQKRQQTLRVAVPLAAVVCAVLAGVGVWSGGAATQLPPVDSRVSGVTNAPDETNPPKVISHFGGETDSCYKTPDNGEYYCFYEVGRARQKYAGQNVVYLLKMNVFLNGTLLPEKQLRQEYQRLSDAGVDFYEMPCLYGEEQTPYTEIVGLFTEEQLKTFQPNPDYGYAFRFVSNGDGSAVAFDETICIRDFQDYFEN